MLQFRHLFLLAVATLTVADPTIAARHAITPLAQVNGVGALPLFGVLKPRQNACQAATETLCADGNGCCPIGQPCGYTTTGGQVYGICRGTCGANAVTCTTPLTLCCNSGELCGTNGLCTKGSGNTLGSLSLGSTAIATATGSINSAASASLSAIQASLSSASASRSSVQASLSSAASSLSGSGSSALASASAAASSARTSVPSGPTSAVASPGSSSGAQNIHFPGWMSIFSAMGVLFRLV